LGWVETLVNVLVRIGAKGVDRSNDCDGNASRNKPVERPKAANITLPWTGLR
jgi:hypothetical protein